MLLNMEKSGLDSLFLVEVFCCLPKLDVVYIDVILFHRIQFALWPAYCGISVGVFRTDDVRKDSTVNGYNRVYKTVLSALEESEIHKDVKLELQFSINTNTSSEVEI